MKKKRAMEWVAALRSGDYKQGHDVLRDGQSNFCCLGVACNLHAQAHPRIAAAQDTSRYYMNHDTDLPPSVQKWMGMFHDTGRRADGKAIQIGRETYFDLAEANDGGATFKEIADYIEKNYKHL